MTTWETEVIIGQDAELPEGLVVVRCRTGERVRYVPERTCRPELKGLDPSKAVNTFHCACSECGCPIDQKDSYCRSCGAGVVDE